MTVPESLKERGQKIWEAYSADDLPAASRAMVHELCRMADALDRLDALLGGRAAEWIKVLEEYGDGEVTLEVNGVLGERRQHALAFTTMLREIRMAGIEQNAIKVNPTEGRAGLILSLVQDVG